MKPWFTIGELVILIAAIILLISLPWLAGGSAELWFAAQLLYFIGVALMIWKYFSRYVRY